MSRAGKKAGHIFLRFLGLAVLPLVAGAALGFGAAYFLRTDLINVIDRECLEQVDIEYGHPITLDCFFTKIPPNTKFITNVSMKAPYLLFRKLWIITLNNTFVCHETIISYFNKLINIIYKFKNKK